MILPDVLTVTAVDSDEGGTISNVALTLILFARHKNDYHVGPFVTDATGRIRFTRTECARAIASAQAMFLMDYEGNVESCLPWIEVKLHPPDQLERMMQQYEEAPDFWGRAFENPKTLFASLQKARNLDYEPASIRLSEEEAQLKSHFKLPLTKRDTSRNGR